MFFFFEQCPQLVGAQVEHPRQAQFLLVAGELGQGGRLGRDDDDMVVIPPQQVADLCRTEVQAFGRLISDIEIDQQLIVTVLAD